MRKRWSYDDEIMVCELYFRLTNGEIRLRNPRVTEAAALMERSAGTLCMKLQNFVFLDPDQKVQGRRGWRTPVLRVARSGRNFRGTVRR